MMIIARSMQKDKNLPRELWGKAVNTSVYILNRAQKDAWMEPHHMKFGQE